LIDTTRLIDSVRTRKTLHRDEREAAIVDRVLARAAA
jgi:hypothetical protein